MSCIRIKSAKRQSSPIRPSVSVGNVMYPDTLPPPGHLIFNADFESGNLGRADKITTSEYDLFIRPDTLNNKYRVWFYFECKNALENQRVIFNIVNFSKQRSLFENGVAAPVVKLNVQHSWSRIPSRHIYYYRSAQHSDRWILSFAFIFDSSEPVKFAYCIPYTYTDLQKWLCDIEARNYQFFRRDVLTYTIQKRQIDLITVESTADNLSTAPKKMIVITARVHPGETPSSHVLHGFLEFLVSSDERAQKLRKVYCFKIIPMLNPDGVCLGNYRCSLMGNDLNRMWRVPSDWAHPSIFCVKNLLQQYDSNPQINIIMYIDLHAHSQKPNCFLYGNLSTQLNNTQMMRLLWLPHILAELSDDYSLDFTQFNTDAEKAGTGRRTMGDLLSCICYTMEVSFFSYKQCESSGLTQCIPYLQYKYESLGEALCKSILNFYEIDCGIRDVSIQRAFKTFLPARAQKGLKQARQMIKTVQTLSKHA